jgi:hypothetical protein
LDCAALLSDAYVTSGGFDEAQVRTATILASPLVREGLLVPVLEKHWLRMPIHAVHAGANPPAARVRALIALLKEATPAALGYHARDGDRAGLVVSGGTEPPNFGLSQASPMELGLQA